MDEPSSARPAESGAAHSGDDSLGGASPAAANPGVTAPDSYRRWNYVGAIAGGVAALLIVVFGVAVPLQVIPPKKEEAVAMVVPLAQPRRPPEYGLASWYGDHEAGQLTASGAVFKPDALTAAHRWLPLGTKVRVTRVGTKHSTVVTINDRGPYVGGRLIDLSPAAARQLAMVQKGVARVRVDILEVPHPDTTVARAPKKPKRKPHEEIASKPAAETPTPNAKPGPAEAAPTVPAEAAAPQVKPVDAKPAPAPEEPASMHHFP